MNKFKIGDKFIPHKPKNTTRISWPPELDEFDGKILTVSGIGYFDSLEVKETGFVFDPDWCEKVEEVEYIITDDLSDTTTNQLINHSIFQIKMDLKKLVTFPEEIENETMKVIYNSFMNILEIIENLQKEKLKNLK